MNNVKNFDNRTTREVDEYRFNNAPLPNRKPYRTREQKTTARRMAKKIKGRWVSPAPVSYH